VVAVDQPEKELIVDVALVIVATKHADVVLNPPMLRFTPVPQNTHLLPTHPRQQPSQNNGLEGANFGRCVPFRSKAAFVLGLALLGQTLGVVAAAAPVAVLTYHNDIARTGQNINETILTLANVNTNTFGMVFSHQVDDWVYAQPLVMTNVSVPGKGVHNLVLVATVNDTVYAFDADDPNAANPYWVTSFLGPNVVAVRNTDMTGACGGNYQDFHGNMGIVGTPVIDPVAGTLYVVAKTKENGSTFVQRLHALNVATGAERPGSPVVISASLPGTGDGGASIVFDPMKENQRPGLALLNGVVYIGWASHCDWGPYHGWLIGYDALTLTRVAAFLTTPNGGLGGIWQSGGAPAIDAGGNLYFETGNGTFSPGSSNYGDSFLRVSTTNGLALQDYFTPYNQSSLNSADLDIGSGGAMLLPDAVGSAAHPHLLVGGSKAGTIYLLDRDNMGHFNANADTNIVQSVVNGTKQCYDTPAYFNRTLYMAGTGDPLKAYSISNAAISAAPLSQSPTTYGFSAPTASVSANGQSNAIVWALQVDGWGSGLPAILHVYNATNLALEIYSSSQAGARDTAPGAVKFTVPVVANGKVYVGGQYGLAVYSAVSGFVAAPSISPNGATITSPVMVTLSDSTAGSTIYYTLDGSTPNTNSLLYTGAFQVTNTLAVKARAVKPGWAPSPVALASFISASALGNGTGLVGAYYSNHYPTNAYSGPPTLVRTDAVVNFNWGSGSPDPSISVDHFTARWTGSVQPIFSETYTFYTTTDDGVRLWINGQLVLDHWVDQGPTEWSGSLLLLAQQKYNLEMDYYENGGGAVAMLSWSSPSTAKATIPQTQLYTTSNLPPVVTLIAPTNHATYTATASITLVANATDPDDAVSKVDFYASGTYLGTATNSPYAITATGIAANTYALTAVASDRAGVTATSAPVTNTVKPGTFLLYGINSRPLAPAFFNMPSASSGALPQTLSQSGLFTNTAALTPSTGLLPYTVNVPLWADNASIAHWFSVPNNGGSIAPNEQIVFAPTGEWTFPAGSVFVQHFALATDETKPGVTRRLETRVLVSDTNGAVYGVTYKWRPDNSDADLLTTSVSEGILITNASGIRTQTWIYPSPTDCLTCHNPAANYVLGVKTRQLNCSLTYPSTGQTDNQLRTLNRVGMFYPAFDEATIPSFTQLAALTNVNASLQARSLSYLDGNCAQCHRPGGPGPTFDARYDTPFTNQNILYGVLQAGNLGYDNAFVVTPKDVWRSILWHRINTLDTDIQMPDFRTLIDTNAVQVLTDWINSLLGTPALAPPVLNPAGGAFVGPVSVSVEYADTNATFYYTLDNSLPTTNSLPYAGPFILTNSVTVQAKAFEAGYNDSVATTATFSIRPPIFFVSGGYFSNDLFYAQFSGFAGKTYVLEATTDFTNWVNVNTNTATANVFNLFDAGATNSPYRFYRALELP
jgi:hypothetical protein